MLLAVDIGNTNITLGGYNNEKIVFCARLATDSKKTDDQYAVEIKNILDLNGVTNEVNGAIISSVVPAVAVFVKSAIIKLFGIEPMVLGPGIKTGINIKIDNPAELGADLVASGVAAYKKYGGPVIIIDMGTATTIMTVNSKGEFLGGAIAAGVISTINALTKSTSLLPDVDIKKPVHSIGRSTVESMQAGLIYGTAGLIDGVISRYIEILGENTKVVATGGTAEMIIKECTHNIIWDKNLLLDGLCLIYNKNK